MDDIQAFPSVIKVYKHSGMYEDELTEGMTLRDYFAGLAVCGIDITIAESRDEQISHWAYNLADAMLKERSKK